MCGPMSKSIASRLKQYMQLCSAFGSPGGMIEIAALRRPHLESHLRRLFRQIEAHFALVGLGLAVGRVVHLEIEPRSLRDEHAGVRWEFRLRHARAQVVKRYDSLEASFASCG